MDQFDIEGMFNGSVGASWMLPFGQQDANFLTGSRQMLEPIIEETSEDDEESILSYQHYENGAWSSESETGSVIRIELHNDQDTISERDFVCPAKRARRDEILNVNHLTIPTSNHLTQSNNHNNINGQLPESPRRFNIRNNNELLLTNDSDSLINPLSLSSSASSTNFRRRFDDFIYSDSDSLSYNSLSRSSSLIQFESLERQMQNELSSSSIGSSPSLLSFDAAAEERGSNRGSSSSLKRFESSDGRLHQTYLDLDKIDFDNNTNVLTAFRNVTLPITNNIIGHIDQDERQSKSDSESSSSTDNSILSHEERILIRRPMNLSSAAAVNRDQNELLRSSNGNNKGKSSVENLSEDSGYCEHNNYSALRTKSKSIPNFLRTTMNFNEKFYEEDEFENHKSLEELYLKTTCSSNNNNNNNTSGGSSCGGGAESYSDDDIPLSKRSIKENVYENENDCIVGGGQKQQNTTKILKIGEKYNNNNNNINKMKNSKFIEKSSSLSPSPHSWYNCVQKNKNKFSSTSPSEEEESSEEGDIDDNDEDNDNDENDDDSSDCTSASAQFTWKNTNTIKTNLKNRNFQYSVIPSTDTNILNTNFQYSSSSLPDIRVELYRVESENCKNSINSKLSPINNNLNSEIIESEKILSKNNLKKSTSKKYLSSSNNDLCNSCQDNDDPSNKDKYLTTVSSVPKDLNLLKNNCDNNNSDSNKSEENVSLNWNNNRESENRITKDKNTTQRKNFGNSPIEYSEFSLSGKTLNIGSNHMNASYNNITLLDYSLTGPPSIIRPSNNRFTTKMTSNSKRFSRELDDDNPNNDNNDKRNSSLTNEFELGKGNFLLDEISAHFDKNLSILSDRQCNSDLVSEFLEKEKRIPPKPPARRSSTYSENRYSANLSHEQDKSTIENEKLPKPLRQNENVCTEKITFDLDPTNLKTSYTESLERCNFNPKELSTSDLTQLSNNVRNHSTPVKRNFVASTPNLNEYQHETKLSLSGHNTNLDDEYDYEISSTSNSLIQLPIDKRLGILMSTQSKSSLGKSVNFCPVVAEYSWREKSEDTTENYEPDSLENLNQQNESYTILIENDPNTTVIFGCDVTDPHIINNTNNNTENDERIERNDIHSNTTNDRIKRETTFGAIVCSEPQAATNTVNAVNVNGKQLNFGATTMTTTTTISNISNTVKSSNSNANKNGANKKINNNNKLLNKNLPKMETNFDSEYRNGGGGGGAIDNDKKIIIDLTNNLMTNERLNNNNNNLNNNNSNKNNLKSSGNNSGSLTKNQQQPQKQHNLLQSTTVPLNPSNNPELMNSKFKPKPDEKHHKSFLSRFAGGFRFSLRRKKQKQPINELINNQDQKNLKNSNSNNNNNNNNSNSKKKSVADGAIKSKSSSQQSPDFIYIPLKGPKNSELPINGNNYHINGVESNITTNITPTMTTADTINEGVSQNDNKNNHVLLLGKPPLPKQPPRVVGVSEKLYQQQQQQQQQRAGQHAYQQQQQRSSSQPRDEYDNNTLMSFSHKNSILSNSQEFLDNERRYYNNDLQLNNTMNGIGCNINMDCGNNYYDKKPPQPPAQFLDKPLNNNNKKKLCKIGLIETNLDTHETIISGKTRSLMELGPHYHNQNNNNHNQRHTLNANVQKQIQNNQNHDDDDCGPSVRRPHKSMEFLLDKENQKNIAPPENELQKSHDSTAALSEHQLRVQASLQRLNIPDWYRAYSTTPKPIDGQLGYKPGNFTRKRASESGRWTGLNSKTTSLSSLGSQRSDRSPLLLSPSAHSHHGTTHPHSGVGGTNANQSGGFSRWSTSYLNSTQTSPSVSQRGSFSRGGPINSSFSSAAGVAGGSIRNSFRQPYMGWRSQEKINQPRTPHERLASSILAHKPPKPESLNSSVTAASAVTPEIQSSIKEVTSAIVHYVNDQNRTIPSRSRSTSPNSRKCWLESSFVGVRPLESPQTPTLENNSFTTSQNQSIQQQNNLILGSTGYQQTQQYHIQNYSSDILRVNGVGVSPLTSLSLAAERSPSSASLEDVLASLLGLPTDSSSSYRSTGDTANEIIMFRVTQPTNKQQPTKVSTEMATSAAGSSLQVEQQNRLRRRSEGDAQRQKNQQEQQKQLAGKVNNNEQQQSQQSENTASGVLQQPSRRVSLDSSESKTTSELVIKCRNTKCDQTSNPVDAKKYFKSCHNCSHLYCSRECRRAHWEKHRKACLHSRVSNLCRQVLSACKDDVDTLRHLSLLARKGYLSQGRGVVRILFRSPESAEGFIKNGFQCMGEASYVRWPDLMPAEMGLELYSELLRLSTEYKTDTKMLLYVAICVVSEAPGTATAPVKWERQLVSRCAKLKLCKSILNELSDQNQQNNLQQQQQQPNVPADPSTEILILTFNLQSKTAQNQREIILQNILSVLNRRGVILKKHYPEIYQRLQTFADGQSERFMPVTLHPRDSQTGQGFVCIIMPNELIQLPASDIGNHVCTIDVGEELLES